MARQILTGHRSGYFPLLSICMFLRWVWQLYNLPCVSVLFWLISVARCSSICFWGTKYDVYWSVLITCILNCDARLWLKLFASTVDRSLSRVSYLPSNVFSRSRGSFTSRKVYACLEECLLFLADIWWSLCFWSSMYRFFPPLIVLVPQDSNIALHAQVCWLCCVLHMPLFGSPV